MPNHLPRNRSKFLSAGLKTAASLRYSRLRPPMRPPPAVFAACKRCQVSINARHRRGFGALLQIQAPLVQQRHHPFTAAHTVHRQYQALPARTWSQSSSDRKTAELSLSVSRGSPLRTSVKCGSWVPKPMPSTAIAPCTHNLLMFGK